MPEDYSALEKEIVHMLTISKINGGIAFSVSSEIAAYLSEQPSSALSNLRARLNNAAREIETVQRELANLSINPIKSAFGKAEKIECCAGMRNNLPYWEVFLPGLGPVPLSLILQALDMCPREWNVILEADARDLNQGRISWSINDAFRKLTIRINKPIEVHGLQRQEA